MAWLRLGHKFAEVLSYLRNKAYMASGFLGDGMPACVQCETKNMCMCCVVVLCCRVGFIY